MLAGSFAASKREFDFLLAQEYIIAVNCNCVREKKGGRERREEHGMGESEILKMERKTRKRYQDLRDVCAFRGE
jgi:hypothetical protein